MQQLPLHLAGAAPPSLDNFAVGANAAALTALRGLLRDASATQATPVIYLWGEAGSGKTHLLRALARAAVEAGRSACVFDADAPLPWRIEDVCAPLVLLDGCEALSAQQQHAAFALFIQAADAHAPVVAAGRLPPVDLPVREDLRSRLGWGLVFQLQPADEAAVRETLRREAAQRGIDLSDEVLAYLLSRFARDLGSMMALLDALDDFALSQQRALTVPLVRQMIAARAPVAGEHATGAGAHS